MHLCSTHATAYATLLLRPLCDFHAAKSLNNRMQSCRLVLMRRRRLPPTATRRLLRTPTPPRGAAAAPRTRKRSRRSRKQRTTGPHTQRRLHVWVPNSTLGEGSDLRSAAVAAAPSGSKGARASLALVPVYWGGVATLRGTCAPYHQGHPETADAHSPRLFGKPRRAVISPWATRHEAMGRAAGRHTQQSHCTLCSRVTVHGG